MPVIDGTQKFACSHQFLGLGFGFSCINCGHFRHELALDTRKAIIFFPTPQPEADTEHLNSVAL